MNAELLLAIRRADAAARHAALLRQASTFQGAVREKLVSSLLWMGVVAIAGIPIAMVWHLTRGNWGQS